MSKESFGLACGVMQVLSFSHEFFNLFDSLCDKTSPQPRLEDFTRQMAEHCTEISNRHRALAQRETGNFSKALARIAHQCSNTARSLEGEIKRMTGGSGTQGSLHAVLRRLPRKSRIDTLRREMDEQQQALQIYMLGHLCERSLAAEFLQDRSVETLTERMQAFVRQCALGTENMAALIDAAILHNTEQSNRLEETLKHHVSMEVETATNEMRSCITSGLATSTQDMHALAATASHNIATEAQTKQLLQSLRFEDMNDRRNRLKDGLKSAHRDTCQWVYRPESFGGIREFFQQECDGYWITGKPGCGKSTFMAFLVQDSRTSEYLEQWRSDAKIISHFFWKAGSRMQRGLLGFWCSSLHQLLVAEPSLVSILLSAKIEGGGGDMSNKYQTSDWTIEDLKSAWTKALNAQSFSVCLFLDGLDEIQEDDSFHKIDELLAFFQEFPQVKMCLSSRSEPGMLKLLQGFAQMKFHEFTSQDMHDFAAQYLASFWNRSEFSVSEQIRIIETLMKKAEGVFLWLRLVVRNLNNSLGRDDSFSDLQRRIDELPSEVSEMYQEMWDRENGIKGKTRIHCAESARYFNLMLGLEGQRIDSPYFLRSEPPGFIAASRAPLYVSEEPLRVIHIAFAANDGLQKRVFNDATSVSAAEIEAACIRIANAIASKCVGLIEFLPLYRNSPMQKELTKSFGLDATTCFRKVQFIHRTAFDFVSESEAGFKIRSFDKSSAMDRRMNIAKALCALSLLTPDLGMPKNAIESFRELFTPDTASDIACALSACARVYNHIVYCQWGRVHRPDSFFRSAIRCGRSPFLKCNTKNPFSNWLLEWIAKDPYKGQLATMALTDCFESKCYEVYRPLLALGADLDATTCTWECSHCQKTAVCRIISPTARFLHQAVSDRVLCEDQQVILNDFVAQDTLMATRIPLVMWRCKRRYNDGVGLRTGFSQLDTHAIARQLHFSKDARIEGCTALIIFTNWAYILLEATDWSQLKKKMLGQEAVFSVVAAMSADANMLKKGHFTHLYELDNPAISDDFHRFFAPWMRGGQDRENDEMTRALGLLIESLSAGASNPVPITSLTEVSSDSAADDSNDETSDDSDDETSDDS